MLDNEKLTKWPAIEEKNFSNLKCDFIEDNGRIIMKGEEECFICVSY